MLYIMQDDSDTVVHPYGIEFDQSGNVRLFPAVRVLLETISAEQVSLICLIDSGATISALPKSDATILGIEYKNGEKIKIAGIDSSVFFGWRHIITTDITGHSKRIPWVFVDSDDAPRILGREGIFDNYSIIFEQRKNRTALVGKSTMAALNVSKVLDGL